MFWFKLQCFFIAISYGVSINPLENLKANLSKDRSAGIQSNVICGLCNFAVNHLISKRRDFKYTDKHMEIALNTMCALLSTFLNYQGICKGLVKSNLKPILYIIDNTDADGEYACSILLQNRNCATKKVVKKWNINIASKNGTKRNLNEETKSLDEPLQILHIADIHYDPHYSMNASLPCNRPLCCQDDDKIATNNKNRAGFWTDYSNCDTPSYFIEETFQFIKNNMRYNCGFLVTTGDVISHRIWDTSVASNKKDIAYLMGLFKQHFKTIPVLPVLGNHETHPVNVYAPSDINSTELSTTWLYNYIADVWSDWLPESALDTVRKGGYYTLKLKSGLRIIALNNNVAYTLNYWLIYKDEDMYDQLQWLSDTLQLAEKNEEKVHILAHLPFGDSESYVPWSKEFKRIITRYSKTITAAFYGHTHFDELNIFMDDTFKNPINLGFNGGSLTPYSNVNPNFKILSVDPSNFKVQDYDVWSFNLTEANKNLEKELSWKINYSFKSEYNLSEVSPNSLFNLFRQMVANESLREKYYRNKVRRSNYFLRMGCDNNCHQENLCNMITTIYSEQKQCSQHIPKNLYT